MNAFLNILKYGLVVILVILALCIIACGFLVLFPGSNLFGITYISYDGKQVETQFATNTEDSPLVQADTVRIDSGTFDVNIEVVNTVDIVNGATHMTCRLSRMLSGFVFGTDNNKPIVMTSELTKEGDKNILDIVITQPTNAWLFPTETMLDIYVPSSLFQTKDLEIISTSGSVRLGSTPEYNKDNEVTNTFLNMNALSINNQTGNVTLGCVNFNGDLTVTKESGDITAYQSLPDTNLSVKSGFGTISIDTVGTATTPKSLTIDGIWNSSVNIGTVYGGLVAKNIDSGLFKISKLIGESSIENGSADVYIDEVNGAMSYKADDGTFKLTTITSALTLQQGSGSVNIEQLGTTSQLLTHSITTNGANVDIKELRDSVDVTTKGGNVTVNNVVSTEPVNIKVDSLDGEVKLLNVNGTVTYTCTDEKGTSSAYVKYSNFVGKNTYINQSGNVEIVMPYDKQPTMWIRWETRTVANIELFGFESDKTSSSALDEDVKVTDGDNTIEYGIALNEATTDTQEMLSIATRVGHISVYRQSVAG